MKIIFLDIDGVLNSRVGWAYECKQVGKLPSHRMSPGAVARLRMLVQTTGAKIVVSSTWRIIYSMVEISDMLERYGIVAGTIIGETPRCGRRGHEISAWLKANRAELNVTDYVILDDDPEAQSAGTEYKHHSAEIKLNHFVKTDWVIGLTATDAIRAKKILSGEGANLVTI